HTNAGDWSFGKVAKIGLMYYTHTGNVSSALLRSRTGGTIDLDEFIGEIPTGSANIPNGIFQIADSSVRVSLNRFHFTDEVIGVVRSDQWAVKRQVMVGEYLSQLNSLSTITTS